MIKNLHNASLAIVIILTMVLPVHSDQSKQQAFAARIKTVNELITQASSTNGLWRETKELSDSAKAYAQDEDFTHADKALAEAEFQAKQGIQQALEQEDISTLIPAYLRH